MNKFTITLLLFFSILFVETLPAMADEETDFWLVLDKEDKDKKDPKPETDNEGRRKPSIPVICHINKNEGISITGITEPIISYYLYMNQDNPVIFYNEDEFIFGLISMKGEVSFIFETENYYLKGFIYLNELNISN